MQNSHSLLLSSYYYIYIIIYKYQIEPFFRLIYNYFGLGINNNFVLVRFDVHCQSEAGKMKNQAATIDLVVKDRDHSKAKKSPIFKSR